MRVAMRFILLALLLSCGGSGPVEWAGKWKQPAGFPAGTWVECTLGGTGTAVTGSGIQHREAGSELPFAVSGTAEQVPDQPRVTFTYDGGTTEAFVFGQLDRDHISLANAQRTVNLVRQP
jgi:hypothetical protein